MKRILYDVPKWHTFLHREARDQRPADEGDAADAKWSDEVFDRLYGGPAQTPLAEGERDASLSAWAQRFHDQARQVPAFERLAADCQGDAYAAAVAVDSLERTLNPGAALRAEQAAQKKAQQQPARPGAGLAALARAKAGGGDADKMRRAIMAATAKAEREVDAARDAAEGLAAVGLMPGFGPGDHTGTMDVATVKRLVKALASNPQLRKIADLAGRMRRIAAQKRRLKVTHGADEISDVEIGGDVPRLLPSEMVKLKNRALRLTLLRDLTERRALQYRLLGKETKGRGPVVVLTDKSGSMNGNPDTWATSVALAVLSEAQRQRRAFAFIPFDSRPMAEYVVQPGGTLPEEALFVPASGGTDIHRAMEAALDLIERERGTALGKADVVLITDGGSDATLAPHDRERAKALGVHTIGFGIGVPREQMTPWCDDVHAILRLDTLEDGAAEALFAGKEEP